MKIIKKINMKRFIYFFVFFLLLTLGLFYILETSGERAVQESLINSSKNQISYAESVLNSVINEASTYSLQFTADDSVRYYQSQKQVLSLYDSQMQKNDILNRLTDPLLSSQAIKSIGIYWKSDGDFIQTGGETSATFAKVTKRGWQTVGGSLYYFSVYPYFLPAKDLHDIQYVVGVRLKPEYLTGLLEKAFNGSNSNAFFLVNKSMLITNKTVNNEIVEEAKKTIKPNPQEILKVDYKTDDGNYYVLSKYVEPIDTYLITYTRTNVFLNPLNQNHQIFLVSIGVILILGLIVITMFYRNFYQNVHLLNKKFYQVEQGDYMTRISENPDNEFNNLFKSFNHMVAKIQTLFVTVKVETELRRNAEFKQLQAQINPHFLYNSLFFIMSLAKTSPEAVMQMSKHLAEYYRYMTNKDSQDITLASELELAEHYLSIMALCKEIKYEINLAPELREHRFIPLIIQPVVENAIQHGIEGRQGAHRVSIDVTVSDSGAIPSIKHHGSNWHQGAIPSIKHHGSNWHQGALISIANDGKGLTPDEIQQLTASIGDASPPKGTNGIGLWNVNQRLRNTYGDNSGLRFFTNDWGGLTVMFFIDFSLDGGGHHAITNR